jgi:hypothetical protein
MGMGQALMQPQFDVKGRRIVTPEFDLIRSLFGGTGLASSYGLLFHNKVIAGNFSSAQLAEFKYIYAANAQIALDSIRSDDETNWGNLKSYYFNAGLDRPKRLLGFIPDTLRWCGYSVDYYQDDNIYDRGPMWDLDPKITSWPGAKITLPLSSAVDPGYQSTQSGLTFAQAKAVLDDDGWSWSNFIDNPFDADVTPYELQRVGDSGDKEFRIILTRMKINNDNWIEALVNLLVAWLEDKYTGLPVLDGIMGQFPKIYHYYSRYRTGIGNAPGYAEELDNPASSGIGHALLEYWTRTRSGGPEEIAYPWKPATNAGGVNDPAFPSAQESLGNTWDLPSLDGYEYLEGCLKIASKIRSHLDTNPNLAGLTLHWSLVEPYTDNGIWQSGHTSWRLGYRDDYIVHNPGGTRQQAQDALLAKIVELRSYCDGLVLPSTAEAGVDPYDAGVTVEPEGWWESLHDAPMEIQYATTLPY